MTRRSCFGFALAAILLAGCATAGGVASGDSAALRIADDAAAFNDAYARAVSGQILLNVLRARDRQPRYYLSMSGIADSPSLLTRENAGVSGAPLGEAGAPWGFGGFGVERETQSRPSYAVEPLNADTLIKTVFQPTPTNVFAHYWTSGWSRDLLLFLMVERITRIERGHSLVVVNDATNIEDDCRDGAAGGCAFVRVARQFLAATAGREEAGPGPGARSVCGLVAAYAPAHPVREGAPGAGKSCPPTFVVGEVAYAMDLRSFDDMVYYVGELMRPSLTESGDGAVMASRLTVFAAGLRTDVGAPLFRILPADAAAREAPVDPRRYFAAGVNYGGRRYYAGPPVGRTCPHATPSGACSDDPRQGDRTSSVLSLLAEILALNQSPDALHAPTRVLTQ